MLDGYVWLWRRLLDSAEWKTMTDGQRCVMVTCLLLADWKDDPGRLDCGEEQLATDARVSRMVVRRALTRMVATGFLRRCGGGEPRKEPRRRAKDGRIATTAYRIIKWDEYQCESQGEPRLGEPKDYIEDDLRHRSNRSTFTLEHPLSKPKKKQRDPENRIPKEQIRPAIDAYIGAMRVAHGVELKPTQPLYVAMRNVVRQYGPERALRLAAGWPLVENPAAQRAGYPVAWIPNNEAAIEMSLKQREQQTTPNYRPVVDE